VLLTWLLPFLATEGSRVLEKKANDTQVSKTVFSHLKSKVYRVYVSAILRIDSNVNLYTIYNVTN